MRTWKIIGLIATLSIVLFLALYMVKRQRALDAAPQPQDARFTGSPSCRECHKKEYDEWLGSHHERSMDTAKETSVLGDFNNAVFERHEVRSTFFQRDDKYFVHTEGPEGKMADFEITHTFGWFPLQQYLVPFPGGRLQCLPIAWDSRENKWFHLYGDEKIQADNWRYWTQSGQTWNGMCADCHSTNLKKNYDPRTDQFSTTWSEINVGCEACHGPGSLHIEWAKLPAMARDREDDGLIVRTDKMDNRQQIESCVLCHSRRTVTGDYAHAAEDMLDSVLPRLLEQELYYTDGQILEEVYVYGSFVQSKMFTREIKCSDCHNIHTLKPHQEGNTLCLQCHEKKLYDTREHHFHKFAGEQGEPIRSANGEVLFEVGTGAECVGCHMPGRTYMGNDYRPDHSLRVPRPDLNVSIGVPDACSRCHVDKDTCWSAEYTKKWYGEKNKTITNQFLLRVVRAVRKQRTTCLSWPVTSRCRSLSGPLPYYCLADTRARMSCRPLPACCRTRRQSFAGAR